MIITFTTLAILFYLRHVAKNMWEKGQCRYVLISIVLFVFCIVYISYTPSYQSPKFVSSALFTKLKEIKTSNESSPAHLNDLNDPMSDSSTKTAILQLDHDIVKQAIKSVIVKMNKLIQPYPQCAEVDFFKIIKSNLEIVEFKDGEEVNLRFLDLENEQLNKWSTLQLTFEISPGQSIYTAKIKSVGKAIYTLVDSIKRINSTTTTNNCITDSKDELINEICICKDKETKRKRNFNLRKN